MHPRFFVEPNQITSHGNAWQVVIDGDDAHHIERVLRLRPGAPIWIANGMGLQYPGKLRVVERGKVVVDLEQPQEAKGEPAHHITLFQGLPKSDKMDWVAQKAAEIGISDVVPVPMERSVVALSGKKADNRLNRWRRIAKSASQQASRGRIPNILELSTLSEGLQAWRDKAPQGLLLVPWEEEQSMALKAVLQSEQPMPKHLGIVIGPEGGMTVEEIEIIRSFGGRPCTLGPRILRTETAGVVVAALALYELGDMGG